MIRKVRLLPCGLLLAFSALTSVATQAQDAPSTGISAQPAGSALGTVTAVNGQSITLKTDAGAELAVTVSETTRLLQLKPGEKDLKQATPLALPDLKAGDRVLVRGLASSD